MKYLKLIPLLLYIKTKQCMYISPFIYIGIQIKIYTLNQEKAGSAS